MRKSVNRWHLQVVRNNGGVFLMKFGYILIFQILLLIAVPVTWCAENFEFDGLIEPHMTVKVGSGVAGTLATVNVERGDMIKKGQVLATLESGVERATMELARARAKMEASIKSKQALTAYSERKQQRLEELFKKEVLPFDKMDEAKINRILAELELQEAMENKHLAEMELKRATEVVKRMTIVSPVKGVVVERFLSPGEYIETQHILELAQLDPLNVEVILPVDMFGSIKLGMEAEVKPEAPLNDSYRAKVTIVDRVVDAASGTFGVRLEIPNPKYNIPPGLKCKIIFQEK
jgi:RND family efflux transporter MFP subunit